MTIEEIAHEAEEIANKAGMESALEASTAPWNGLYPIGYALRTHPRCHKCALRTRCTRCANPEEGCRTCKAEKRRMYT